MHVSDSELLQLDSLESSHPRGTYLALFSQLLFIFIFSALVESKLRPSKEVRGRVFRLFCNDFIYKGGPTSVFVGFHDFVRTHHLL